MAWKLPRLQFGLRGLLLVVFLSAIGAWLYTNRPERMRAFRNQQARARIDPYELAIAGDSDPSSVPPELVAILGDSRLKHWKGIDQVRLLEGNRAASHAMDGTLRIWDATTGRQTGVFPALGCTATADRQGIFAASPDGTLHKWSAAASWQALELGEPVQAERMELAVNADGSLLVAEAESKDGSRQTFVWDVANKRLLHRLPASPGGNALGVTRDGRFLTRSGKGQVVEVREVATGDVVRTIGPVRVPTGEACWLSQATLSANETKLYVGSALGEVVVFDWATGEEIERIAEEQSGGSRFALGPQERWMLQCGRGPAQLFYRGKSSWSPSSRDASSGGIGLADWYDNKFAVSAGHQVSFRNYALAPWRVSGGPTRSLTAAAFHPDGQRLFVADDQGEIGVWSLEEWQFVRSWQAHDSPIERFAMAAGGSRLVSTARDGIVIWDDSGREVGVFRDLWHAKHVALSPDGSLLAANPQQLEEQAVVVWDAATGQRLRAAGQLKRWLISPPVWSPDGKVLACFDSGHVLQAFDAQSGKSLSMLGKPRRPEFHGVWLADNRRLITVGWGKDEVHVLEVGKTAPVQTIRAQGGYPRCVAVHPSEEWIAVCGEKTPVQIWHLPTSKLVKLWQIGPPAGVVSQVTFSPDGHYLATVNGNGTVYVLSLDGVLD